MKRAATNSSIRLALVIYSLRAGGAERVAATLANHWVGANKDVTLVTFDPVSTDFYNLDTRVSRVSLNAAYRSVYRWHVITNFIRRMRRLRRFLKISRFDLVLSLGDKMNVQVLMAGFGAKSKILVAEHNDPRRHKLSLIPTILRRLCYRRADALVVLTAGMRDWARDIAKTRPVYVVPNPISEEFVRTSRSNESHESFRILAMGRFTPQKGFDLLLEAFAECAKRHPAWTLRFIGEGEELLRLRRISFALGINSQVEFCPLTREPRKAMQEADLFVLSSRYEGFPMALLEALASGLPAISFDCMSGPREMIRHGGNGILVPDGDVPKLAAAMDKLMSSESDRRMLASHHAEISERYGIAAISVLWEQIFKETLHGDASEQSSAPNRIHESISSASN